ncbi:multicopper oxidase family protein [Leucobacter aridicollis]|uniref:multicopper oxidase family protein n=1 Tax=Leucobacter aridicollis TaxID=283878 RepID=UPI0037C7EB9C
MPGSSRITRRGVLAAAAAGAVTTSILALGGWRVARRPVISPESGSGSPLPPGATTARVPLAVPALDEGTVGDDGVRAFELVAQAGESSFVAGVRTPTWGYNGAFGGPTLRATQGERVRVVVRNELAEVTTTHWHGMKLPAIADGGPHQPIAPGDSWTAEWTVEQPAATLWYHPHNHGTTEAHVYRGLAGLFIVDDAESPMDAPLPREYGVDDIPVVVTDRSFSADGTFDERRRDAAGMLGDTLLVNGTVSPRFAATRELTRLRILNGSTARSYRFELDAGPLLLVGTDSGLLPEPVEVPGGHADTRGTGGGGRRACTRRVRHAALGAPHARAAGHDGACERHRRHLRGPRAHPRRRDGPPRCCDARGPDRLDRGGRRTRRAPHGPTGS